MTDQGRRDAVVRMIKDFQAKGIRIDGVGMQGHWKLDHPNTIDIEKSIVAYAETGVQVHITELDIDLLPYEDGMYDADIGRRLQLTDKNNPYANGLPEMMQKRLAHRYADIFRIFLKHSDSIERVTFWGVTDRDSWLNNWPIRGRTSYPLLFDHSGRPKAAFHAVIKAAQAAK
jgi:endo-1,4-beta-xylanase